MPTMISRSEIWNRLTQNQRRISNGRRGQRNNGETRIDTSGCQFHSRLFG